ncbi:DUF2336 domain-containing protein [Sphingomonas sp. PB2P19]|uniref:DUF2336 domain-containing protein n=1 Tax=Sphingomonas rhamnosi TaxID=3096156 RepID=UPI002FCC7C92
MRFDAVSRAEQARVRAEARLAVSIADFFLDAETRLDERTRLALARVLGGIVDAIETDIRRHAARLLANGGDPARGETMLKPGGRVVARLTRANLLHDDELMDELIARVRHDLIADALPVAIAGPDESSLLVRLASVPDRVVASAANALLASESRRRAANEAGIVLGSDLPAELHHRLVWWIAAAVREGLRDGIAATDQAIADAALRCLSAHDEGDRPEAVAMRLAAAIDARPEELPALLVEAIGDRRLSLFVAVLAHAIGIDFDQARRIVLEPDGDRLWLALRAADLDRPTIARIGLALSDADPRRDIEAFADALDAIAAVTVAEARAAIAPLALHRDFRAAMRALARSDPR